MLIEKINRLAFFISCFCPPDCPSNFKAQIFSYFVTQITLNFYYFNSLLSSKTFEKKKKKGLNPFVDSAQIVIFVFVTKVIDNMGKGTHFFGQPVYGQLIKCLNKDKIVEMSRNHGGERYIKSFDG